MAVVVQSLMRLQEVIKCYRRKQIPLMALPLFGLQMRLAGRVQRGI